MATHRAPSDSDDDPAVPRGPRKKAHSGPHEPRLTLHKARAAWFGARVTWPLREAPLRRLEQERARAHRTLPAARMANRWTLAGPSNIGGRCTALLCDPHNADRLWIGSAGGGVWASTDAGRHWSFKWRAGGPLQIGSLALDPQHPSTLYCGTGEANGSADSYPGNGIYRSSNGGASWRLWASCERARPLRSAHEPERAARRLPDDRAHVPRRIGSMAVDPFDPAHVLVGGVGFGRVSGDNDFGGLYRTRDSGRTWQRETFVSPGNYWCHKVVFDPTRRGRIYIAVTEQGMASGLYRSIDGGATWQHLVQGLPRGDRFGRAALAQAASDPQRLYCIVADAAGNADGVLGVFRSNDGGDSWADVAGAHFVDEGQMSYGSAIAVHPTDPDHVICGGVDLHRTSTGGRRWAVASHWDAERGSARYAHADHHTLLMPADKPGRIYSANDGGMDCSDDGGLTWTNRSNGLAVTMYYDIDVAQSDIALFGGGSQDNGTLITATGRADDAYEIMGGDGGWLAIDAADSGHLYASAYNCDIARQRNGRWIDASPAISQAEKKSVWMVYITIDPHDSNTVFTGTRRVLRTRDDGLHWQALTPVLDGSPISAIEVAAADSGAVYVGTENGGFFRSLDGGITWSANLAGGAMPGVTITRIETHPADARTVFVTLANFGNRHLFRSTDSGASWTDIDGGHLPDVPHHGVLVRPDASQEVWVCNDAGVYMSGNDGRSWHNASANLPPAMVVDLVYHQARKTLFAATYGRSVWRLVLV